MLPPFQGLPCKPGSALGEPSISEAEKGVLMAASVSEKPLEGRTGSSQTETEKGHSWNVAAGRDRGVQEGGRQESPVPCGSAARPPPAYLHHGAVAAEVARQILIRDVGRQAVQPHAVGGHALPKAQLDTKGQNLPSAEEFVGLKAGGGRALS